METVSFSIEGPLLITPKKLGDSRGFLSEVYNQRIFDKLLGKVRFVQDNHSLSAESGTIRGLHFQKPPRAQSKLVRVVRGAIFDVAVDIRRRSPTYGKYVSAILSADNWSQLWLPIGFAHGFCTLKPKTEVVYKVTDFYSDADDRGIAWRDPDIAIKWPVDMLMAVLSGKDRGHPRLADSPIYFP